MMSGAYLGAIPSGWGGVGAAVTVGDIGMGPVYPSSEPRSPRNLFARPGERGWDFAVPMPEDAGYPRDLLPVIGDLRDTLVCVANVLARRLVVVEDRVRAPARDDALASRVERLERAKGWRPLVPAPEVVVADVPLEVEACRSTIRQLEDAVRGYGHNLEAARVDLKVTEEALSVAEQSLAHNDRVTREVRDQLAAMTRIADELRVERDAAQQACVDWKDHPLPPWMVPRPGGATVEMRAVAVRSLLAVYFAAKAWADWINRHGAPHKGDLCEEIADLVGAVARAAPHCSPVEIKANAG